MPFLIIACIKQRQLKPMNPKTWATPLTEEFNHRTDQYKLQEQEGFIAVTDKSRPKVIADLFGISKKTFKKAIGNLYKKRLITLEEDGIRLREKSS